MKDAVQRALLAAVAVGAPLQAQVGDSIPAHDTFVIDSRALGEPRTILVHRPAGYPEKGQRYPVLYMPDGGIDEDFPHVVHTVDSLVRLRRIPPTIVVGIPNTQRRRDLTGPTTVASDRAIAPVVGGSAAFRRFLRTELMPEIRHRYRTNGETAIVGESLAGLFIVETLLLEPTLFQRYIALSPSLWWNGGALVEAAEARAPRVRKASVIVLAAANEPGIADHSALLAARFRRFLPAATGFAYEPRPDLEHSTIYRQEGPRALWLGLGRHRIGDAALHAMVHALEARCGLPGLELRGVTGHWGKPDSIAGPDGEGSWHYRRGRLWLDLSIADGTVEEWRVRGTPLRGDARRDWRRGSGKRVEAHLAAHPGTSPTTAYALYRGCPQPGMTPDEVRASWGPPTEERGSAPERLFIYGYGIEGQYTWIRFRGDSLEATGRHRGVYQ